MYVAGGVVLATVSVGVGTVLGFSAILLPQLENEGLMRAKSDEGSWIASLINIGQVVGSVVTGILAGMLGRKVAIVGASLILVIAWGLIGFSNGVYLYLVIGRLLQGFAILSSLMQVYLVEISDAQRRGTIAGSGPFCVSTGITLVYVLGALLPWRLVCLVCAILPAATCFIMPFMPETPTWLASKGRSEEAEKALRWLRGPDANVAQELSNMFAKTGISSSKVGDDPSTQVSTVATSSYELSNSTREAKVSWQDEAPAIINNDSGPQTSSENNKSGLGGIFHELSKPTAYRPFILLLAIFLLQQSTGTFAVIFYAVNVFQDVGLSASPYVGAILTGVIRQLGTLLGAFLLPRFPRKALMMSSAFFMGISLIALGLTVQYNSKIKQQDNATRIWCIENKYLIDDSLEGNETKIATNISNITTEATKVSNISSGNDTIVGQIKNLTLTNETSTRSPKVKRSIQYEGFSYTVQIDDPYDGSFQVQNPDIDDQDLFELSNQTPKSFSRYKRAATDKTLPAQMKNCSDLGIETHITKVLSILPLFEIVAYMMAFGIGVGTVPWLLLGELCPVQVKGITSGVVTCVAYLTIFFVVKAFPLMVVSIQSHGAYYVFATICMVTTVFSYVFIPETRGKTAAELQNLFQK